MVDVDRHRVSFMGWRNRHSATSLIGFSISRFRAATRAALWRHDFWQEC
jgi:hypothetical protein